MSLPRKTLLAGFAGALISVALVIALASIALAAGGPPPVSQRQLDRVRAKIEAVSRAIAADLSRRDAQSRALQDAEQALVQAADRLRQLRKQEAAAEQTLARAQQRLQAAQAKLADQRQRLASQLRAAYELGRPAPLAWLLAGPDPGLAARLAADYDALARARAAAMDRLRQQLAQLQQLADQVRERRDAVAAARQAQQQALADLQRRQQARAAAVAALDARLADERRRLHRLRGAEAEIEKLLAKLGRALGNEPFSLGNELPFARLRGKLPWPLRGPLLAHYGEPKAGGRLQWKGVWIGAPAGSPVRACARGRVAYVGWISAYGLIVVLQHDHDYFTLYGHAESVSAQAGEWVQAGQVIARAGDTGGYRRSGLYLEIRHGVDALDPSRWLVR